MNQTPEIYFLLDKALVDTIVPTSPCRSKRQEATSGRGPEASDFASQNGMRNLKLWATSDKMSGKP
jgi:hypothetical protein